MLVIRLQRVGRKHEPVFRLVLTDSKNGPKSGKFLEILGNFDARKGDKLEFDNEKIKYWITKGVKLSDTIHNLLISKKVIEGKKINNLPKKKPIISLKPDEATKPVTQEEVKPAEATPTKVLDGGTEEPVENKTDEVAEEVVA